jgi:undecaprenyl-diphosphatase
MDRSLFRRINDFANSTAWLHAPAKAYAKYGIVLFAVLLLVAWWRARRTGDLRTEAGIGWAAGAAVVALAVGQVIGHLVDRSRPYAAMPHVHVLVDKTSDVSFPSDHALAVGAVAIGLVLVDRTIGWIAIGLAVLMAFARVYAGAHYPGDVAAGLLIGGGIALLGAKPATKLLTIILERLNGLPVVPLLTGHEQGPDEAAA